MLSEEYLKEVLNSPANELTKVLATELLSLRESQGWIKRSDRMPEDGEIHYLFYCIDGVRRMGFINHGDWAINGKYYDESFVTHWMPLPASPMVEGNADAAEEHQ